MVSRELFSLGTLCWPPSFPFNCSQSLNSPGLATTTSNGYSVMSL